MNFLIIFKFIVKNNRNLSKGWFFKQFCNVKMKKRGVLMLKGKVIIDFEYDEVKKCSWNIQQEGEDELDKENLIYLLQHVAGELMP